MTRKHANNYKYKTRKINLLENTSIIEKKYNANNEHLSGIDHNQNTHNHHLHNHTPHNNQHNLNSYGIIHTPNGEYYKCNYCDKQYKQRSGLWRHNKKCAHFHTNTNTIGCANTNTIGCANTNTIGCANTNTIGCANTNTIGCTNTNTIGCTNTNTINISDLNNILTTNEHMKNEIAADDNKQLATMLKTMLEPILLNIQEDKKITIGLMHQMQTQNKIITDIIPKIGNNNSFNINVFLNEQCRDAINMTDFLNSLQVKLPDLMYTKHNGLVEGISSVFVKELNKLERCKRPIHCSDVKRETLYIKDNDEWERENSKEKLRSAIECVAVKQQKTIFEWEKANENWHESDARAQEYITLVRAVTKDIVSDENKIIRTIIKETVITKSNIKS